MFSAYLLHTREPDSLDQLNVSTMLDCFYFTVLPSNPQKGVLYDGSAVALAVLPVKLQSHGVELMHQLCKISRVNE